MQTAALREVVDGEALALAQIPQPRALCKGQLVDAGGHLGVVERGRGGRRHDHSALCEGAHIKHTKVLSQPKKCFTDKKYRLACFFRLSKPILCA
ncbi:hypothetical protein D9M68_882250 [compost metagenome]